MGSPQILKLKVEHSLADITTKVEHSFCDIASKPITKIKSSTFNIATQNSGFIHKYCDPKLRLSDQKLMNSSADIATES
jgi:hypothetical protein